MNPFNLSELDIQVIDEIVQERKSSFNEARVFITGGTGFIGKWMLSFFVRLSIHSNIEVYILTRNKERFFNLYPFFKECGGFNFIEGDIISFKLPPELNFNFVIHAAADVIKIHSGYETIKQNIAGTTNLLDNIISTKSQDAKMLYLSSGAIYGPLLNFNNGVEERYQNSNMDFLSSYGIGKIISEKLFHEFYLKYPESSVAVARCFAFSGPLLSLTSHLAFGNFIGNALDNNNIIIKGDGTPLRTYQYPTDLVRWLITLLIEVETYDVINVGGSQKISIESLAKRLKELTNQTIEIIVEKSSSGGDLNTYLPDLNKAREKYGLTNEVSLNDSIVKTYMWNKKNHNT
jgi:nucleoside-diphosphate-sugar epimerase